MNDDTKKFIDSLKSKWVGAKGLSQLIHDINERFITKVDATTALNTKVTKVPGKDLSDENYTAFEKNKLDGVESGAQINVLEKVKVNGKLQANADKTVDIFVPTDDNQIANSADYQNGKQVAASIKVETDARTAADNSLIAEISNEANTRSEADSVLTDGLNSEITNRTNADDSLEKKISDEASARTTADSTEATARANADKTLQNNLDKEASARTTADSTLQSNIDKEASARTSADSTEATTRANADKTLQDNLNSHTGNKSNPHAVTSAQVGLGNVANIDQSKAIKSITRSGTTFTATALDGTKTTFDQQYTNTTYTGAEMSRMIYMGRHSEPAQGVENDLREGTATHDYGFYLTASYGDSVTPSTYGNIINAMGEGGGQLFLGWPGIDNVTEHIWYRSHRDVISGWGPWRKLVYTDEIATTVKNFTLLASWWSWSTDHWWCYLTDDLITETSIQEIIPAINITPDQLNALQKANIFPYAQINGHIGLRVFGTKPTIDIPITVIFRGTI